MLRDFLHLKTVLRTVKLDRRHIAVFRFIRKFN